MRTEMTKIFPSNSEPPEETVELWTGGRHQQAQQRLIESKQQKLLCLLRCISRHTDSSDDDGESDFSSSRSRLNSFFSSLLCLQTGTCSQSSVEPSVVEMLRCYDPECSENCKESDTPALCLATCLQASSQGTGDRFLHTVLKRRAPKNTLRKTELRELFDTLDEMESRDPRSNRYENFKRSLSLVGTAYKRSDYEKEKEITKRYRLGLYDCISSYCGQLSGADRKSCIINYCHRSTTIKM